MTDPTPLPRPVVSPDGIRYWDGSEWRQLPGPESEWTGTEWLAKPTGVEAHWTGRGWAVRPSAAAKWSGLEWLEPPAHAKAEWDGKRWQEQEDPTSKWSGTQWISPPPDVRAAWTGRSWIVAPNNEVVWNGFRWVDPKPLTTPRRSASQQGKRIALILISLGATAGAIALLLIAATGLGNTPEQPGVPLESDQPLSVEDGRLIQLLDEAPGHYTFADVPALDKVAFVRAACEYLLDGPVDRGSLYDWMRTTHADWVTNYGVKSEITWHIPTRALLSAGMKSACPFMAYRLQVIDEAGSPSRLESAEIEPLGKGRIEARWQPPSWMLDPEVREKALDYAISYEYRVNNGEWIRTAETSATIEGLEPGTEATVEVRILWGNPPGGAPYGESISATQEVE